MKILVTSGGTREYIDDIRIMTNISSGKLGARITEVFARKGHDVVYLCSRNSERPSVPTSIVIANSVSEVMKSMERLVPDMDIVIHAMAISDFTFDRTKPVKCKSSDLDGFIEYMRETIIPTPKVIAKIKEWNPDCKLVGFKFEVGKSEDELVKIAREQIEKVGSDIVLANDKQMMKEMDNHIAFIVRKDGRDGPYVGKREIAKAIYNAVRNLKEVRCKNCSDYCEYAGTDNDDSCSDFKRKIKKANEITEALNDPKVIQAGEENHRKLSTILPEGSLTLIDKR